MAKIERAKAGVRVRFLSDEVGSHDLPSSYKDELRGAGVEVFDFHTQKGPGNRFQLNFRNHRKPWWFRFGVRLARPTAPVQ